jgi:vacuolar protein sorting-associated protein 13A/C
VSGWSGIKGVVREPAKGYQKAGVKGLVGGVATGTAGLVIKPISGVMDVVTKTSHGINNATKTKEELERSWDARIRPPRPFYEAERLIRPYNKRHADLLRIVPKLTFNMV